VDTVETLEIDDYCRQIEGYLCRRNHGHLIRIVGPSFVLVSGWAARGIPLNVAYSGIDRCVARHERKSRRRPVKVDFCDDDVLDAFEEWRRAVGLPQTAGVAPAAKGEDEARAHHAPSLPSHVERVILRLSEARAAGALDSTFDDLIDRVAHELEVARKAGSGLRGEARQAMIDRLAALDVELLRRAESQLDVSERAVLMRAAEDQLAGFRERMRPEALARAHEGAFDRLVRDRTRLPVVSYHS
jgi:hypothetical protein